MRQTYRQPEQNRNMHFVTGDRNCIIPWPWKHDPPTPSANTAARRGKNWKLKGS